jgi:hypothetical protein
VVDTLETLAASPAPAPVPVPLWTSFVRPMLRPFARGAIERLEGIKAERTRVKNEQLAEHRRRKAEALAARRATPQ